MYNDGKPQSEACIAVRQLSLMWQEIEPYFTLWENITIEQGFLAIIEIEYDEVSDLVPKIPKGTDGWAKHQKGN